jgi:hypothetical protein
MVYQVASGMHCSDFWELHMIKSYCVLPVLVLDVLLMATLPVPPSPVAFDKDQRLLVSMLVKDDMVALLYQ